MGKFLALNDCFCISQRSFVHANSAEGGFNTDQAELWRITRGVRLAWTRDLSPAHLTFRENFDKLQIMKHIREFQLLKKTRATEWAMETLVSCVDSAAYVTDKRSRGDGRESVNILSDTSLPPPPALALSGNCQCRAWTLPYTYTRSVYLDC
ncbi:hypothetical protein J6590_042654 [Homalodisca vitripennis]|nr:hypothetical protein J6590_042654 [Homalodisca vitripennis]